MSSKDEKIQKLVEKGKVDKIIKLTEDREEDTRAAAFEALGNFTTELACEALQNAIRDESPKIRMAVAKAFQKVGSDHVSEALRHQMLAETDPALKAEFEKAMDFAREHRFEDMVKASK